MDPASHASLAVLFNYFRWADELSGRIRDLPADDEPLAALYVRAWLGALSALVQGWKEVGPSHPVIAQVLAHPRPPSGDEHQLTYEELLRIVRRDAFQYVEEKNPPGTEAFLRAPGAIDWAHDLHLAFRAFFDEKQGVKQRG